MIVEVRVDRVWFGEVSETQTWRGDVTVYFVSTEMSGWESGYSDDDGWYHHSRRRLATFMGKGGLNELEPY